MLKAGRSLDVLVAESDTDWAQNPADRRNIANGFLDVHGECPQFSYTRDQKSLTQSSGEAEYCGGGSVFNEGVGLAGLYGEMGFPMPVVMRLDSTAALGMFMRRGT